MVYSWKCLEVSLLEAQRRSAFDHALRELFFGVAATRAS
jgi:hypothetical protein